MNHEEFLRRGGTDLASVLERARAALELGASDVLLGVGSLIEGMGTSRSDLDLLWITSRDERTLPEDDHVPLRVGECLVDVQVWRRADCEALLERFEAWTKSPWRVVHPAKFDLEERTLLHRLVHGRVLHSGSDDRVTSRIPRRGDLARLKLQAARHMARTIQVDMAGYREAGDLATLMFAAQELLGHAVDALLAGHGRTNPQAKWRSHFLRSLPSDWEASLGIPSTGRSASERIWRLHRAPARPQLRAVVAHALRISALARAAFLWSERVLVQGLATSSRTVRARCATDARGRSLPSLDLDIDFWLADGGLLLGRLNGFGETLELSVQEADFVPFFDGETTLREAACSVASRGSRGGAAKQLGRLIQRIERAGFTLTESAACSS